METMSISIIKLLYEMIPHEVVEFVFNCVCIGRDRSVLGNEQMCGKQWK